MYFNNHKKEQIPGLRNTYMHPQLSGLWRILREKEFDRSQVGYLPQHLAAFNILDSVCELSRVRSGLYLYGITLEPPTFLSGNCSFNA